MAVPKPRKRMPRAAPPHIMQAALTLFAERGYSSVTMAMIADRVGLDLNELIELVTDKELLLYPPPSGGFRLVNHMTARPPRESARQALGNAMLELISGVDMDHEFAVLWRRAVARAPEPIRKAALTGPLVRSALIKEANQRTPGPDSVQIANRVLVATCIAASETAFEIWLHQESDQPLLALIVDALTHAGFDVDLANLAHKPQS